MNILFTTDSEGRKKPSAFVYSALTALFFIGFIALILLPNPQARPQASYQVRILSDDPERFLQEIHLPCATGPNAQYAIELRITTLRQPLPGGPPKLQRPPEPLPPYPLPRPNGASQQ